MQPSFLNVSFPKNCQVLYQEALRNTDILSSGEVQKPFIVYARTGHPLPLSPQFINSRYEDHDDTI